MQLSCGALSFITLNIKKIFSFNFQAKLNFQRYAQPVKNGEGL